MTLKPKHQRLLWILAIIVSMSAGLYVVTQQFRTNLLFFYKPSEITQALYTQTAPFRVGGLVQEGSITPSEMRVALWFTLEDDTHPVRIYYEGVPPTLFRQGQGVIATGRFIAPPLLNEKDPAAVSPEIESLPVFVATELLAKHDENYKPPELRE